MISVKELVKKDAGRAVIYREEDGMSVLRGKLLRWNQVADTLTVEIDDEKREVSAVKVSFVDVEDVAKELMEEKKEGERYRVKVQTYEMDESMTETGAIIAPPEAAELVEKLNLRGQKNLLEGGVNKKGIPYRKLSPQEIAVYKAAHPGEVSVEDFSVEIIPLRVLQVIRHAAGDVFKKLEIWYSEGENGNGCILVGYDEKNYSKTDYHILARWGRVLKSYEDLKKIAAKMAKSKYKTAALNCVREAQKNADMVDDTPDEEFLTRSLPSYFPH